jgi:hypothetical protein
MLEKPVSSLEHLLDPRHAAQRLGVCPRTLWGLSAPRGPIPVVKLGRLNLFDPKDLDAYIESRKIRSLAA